MTDPKGPASESPPDLPPLRPSDEDLARAQALLRDEVGRGHLDLEAYERRLDAVYGAKTLAELRAITGDLASEAPGRPRKRLSRLVAGGITAVVVAIVVVVLALRGGGHPATQAQLREPSSDLAAPLSFIPSSSGTTPDDPRIVVTSYLDDIDRQQWDQARALLCPPLKETFPTATAFAARLHAELQQTPEFHQILGVTSEALPRVRYSIGGPNWGGGPYEARVVVQHGHWAVCGAGLREGTLGYLLAP